MTLNLNSTVCNFECLWKSLKPVYYLCLYKWVDLKKNKRKLVYMPLEFFLYLWSLVIVLEYISRVTHISFLWDIICPVNLYILVFTFFWKFYWIIFFIFLFIGWPSAKTLIMLIFPDFAYFHIRLYITNLFQFFKFNFNPLFRLIFMFLASFSIVPILLCCSF